MTVKMGKDGDSNLPKVKIDLNRLMVDDKYLEEMFPQVKDPDFLKALAQAIGKKR